MLWHFAIAIWSQGALNQHRRSKDIGPFQPASIKRHQEWLANYMIFEVLEKPTTVGQRFAEAHNVKALQVSQTAMEDSEPPCSGGGTDTPFLDKQSPQPRSDANVAIMRPWIPPPTTTRSNWSFIPHTPLDVARYTLPVPFPMVTRTSWQPRIELSKQRGGTKMRELNWPCSELQLMHTCT